MTVKKTVVSVQLLSLEGRRWGGGADTQQLGWIRLPSQISWQEWGSEKNKQASQRSYFTCLALLGCHWKCFEATHSDGSEMILCPHISAGSILIFQPELKSCSATRQTTFPWECFQVSECKVLRCGYACLSATTGLWECHWGHLIEAEGGWQALSSSKTLAGI